MAGARTYEDPCGVARALDVVGERWALLVVRELLLGPKRFSGLLAGLTGVSPNVLSQRLAGLDEAGVVRRRRLGPPAGVTVYELTDQGHALEPVLIALSGWGRHRPLPAAGELSADALVLALRTSVVGDLEVSAELELGDDRLALVLRDGALEVRREPVAAPDLRLTTDPATVRSLAFADLPVADAIADGRLELTGDPRLAQRMFDSFSR